MRDIERLANKVTENVNSTTLSEVDADLESSQSSYEEKLNQARALTERLVDNGALPELLLNNLSVFDANGDNVIERYELEGFLEDQNSLNEADRSPFSVALAEAFLARFDAIETADNAEWDMSPGETDGRAGEGAIRAWGESHQICDRLQNGASVFKDAEGHVTGIEYADGRQVTFVYDTQGEMTGWTDIHGNRYVRDGETWEIFSRDGAPIYGNDGEREFTGTMTGPNDDGTFQWTDSRGATLDYQSPTWGARIVEQVEGNTSTTQILENGTSLSVTTNNEGRVIAFQTSDGWTYQLDPMSNEKSWIRYQDGNVLGGQPVAPEVLSFDPESGTFTYLDNTGRRVEMSLNGALPSYLDSIGAASTRTYSLPDGASILSEGEHWYLIKDGQRVELKGVQANGGNITVDGQPLIAADGSYTLRTAAGTVETFNSDGRLTQVTSEHHRVDYSGGRVVRITNLIDNNYWTWDDASAGWYQFTLDGTKLEQYGPADLQNFGEDAFLTEGGFTFVYRDNSLSETLNIDGSSVVVDHDGNVVETRNGFTEHEYPNGPRYAERGGESWLYLQNGTQWHLTEGVWQLEDSSGEPIDASQSVPLLLADVSDSGDLFLMYASGARVTYLANGDVVTTISDGVRIREDVSGNVVEAAIPVQGTADANVLVRTEEGWSLSRQNQSGSALVSEFEGELRVDGFGPFIILADGRHVRFDADGTYSVGRPDGSSIHFDRNGQPVSAFAPDGTVTESFVWQGDQLQSIQSPVSPDPVLAAHPATWALVDGMWAESIDGQRTGRLYRVGENGVPELLQTERRADGSQVLMNDAVPPQIERMICSNGTTVEYSYENGQLTEALVTPAALPGNDASGQPFRVVLDPSRAGTNETTENGDVVYTNHLFVDLDGNLTYQVEHIPEEAPAPEVTVSRTILCSGWELNVRNGEVVGTSFVNGNEVIDRHFVFAPNGQVYQYVENGRTFNAGGVQGQYSYGLVDGNITIPVWIRFDGAGNVYSSVEGEPETVTSASGWSYRHNQFTGELLSVSYIPSTSGSAEGGAELMQSAQQGMINLLIDNTEYPEPGWTFTNANGESQYYSLGEDNRWHACIPNGDGTFSERTEVAFLNISSTPDGRIMRLLEDGSVQVINLDGTITVVQSQIVLGTNEEALRERARLIHDALDRPLSDEDSAYEALIGMTLADRLLLARIYDDMYGQRSGGNALMKEFSVETYGESAAMLQAELFRSDDNRPNDRGQIDRALALLPFDQEGGETALRNVFAMLTRADIEQLMSEYPGLMLEIENHPLISAETRAAIEIYSRGRDNNFDNGFMRDDVVAQLAELAYVSGDYRMFCEAMRNASPAARQEFLAAHPDLENSDVFGGDKTQYVNDWIETGEISLVSLVEGNCPNIFYHNKDAISTDMLNASPRQRELFTVGYQIALEERSEDPSLSEYERQAVAYYNDLHDALEGAGMNFLAHNESDVIKWEALLIYGDCLIAQVIGADNHDADHVLPMLEQMSGEELTHIVNDSNYRQMLLDGLAAVYGMDSYEYIAATRIINDKLSAYNFAVGLNEVREVAGAVIASADALLGTEFASVVTLGESDPATYASQQGRRTFVDFVYDAESDGNLLLDGILHLSPLELSMLHSNAPIPEYLSAHFMEGSSQGYYDFMREQIRERCGDNADLVLHMLEMIQQKCPPASVEEALEPYNLVFQDILSDAEPATLIRHLQEALIDPANRALLQDAELSEILNKAFDEACFETWLTLPDYVKYQRYLPALVESTVGMGYGSSEPNYDLFRNEVAAMIFAGASLPLETLCWFDDVSSDDEHTRFNSIVDYLRPGTALEELRDLQQIDDAAHLEYVRAHRDELIENLTEEQIAFLDRMIANNAALTQVDEMRFLILGGGEGAAAISDFLSGMEMEQRISLMIEYATIYGSDFRHDLHVAVGDDLATRIEYSLLIDPVHITQPRDYVYLSLFHYLDANSGWAADMLFDSTSDAADMGFNELAAAVALGEMDAEDIREIWNRTEALLNQFTDSQLAFTQNVEMVISTVAALLMSVGCPPLAVGRLAMAFVGGAAFRVGLMSTFLGRTYDEARVPEDAFIGGLNFMLNYIGPQHFSRALAAVGFGDEVAKGVLAGLGTVDEAAEASIREVAMRATVGNGGRLTQEMVEELMRKVPALGALDETAVRNLVEQQIRNHFVGLGRQVLEKGVILAIGSGAGGFTAGADVVLFHLDPNRPFFEQVLPAVQEGMRAGAVGAIIFSSAFQVGGAGYGAMRQWIDIRFNGTDMTARFQEDATLVLNDGTRVQVHAGTERTMADVQFVERPGVNERIPIQAIPVFEGRPVEGAAETFEVRINNELVLVRRRGGNFVYDGGARAGQPVDVVLRVDGEIWVPARFTDQPAGVIPPVRFDSASDGFGAADTSGYDAGLWVPDRPPISDWANLPEVIQGLRERYPSLGADRAFDTLVTDIDTLTQRWQADQSGLVEQYNAIEQQWLPVVRRNLMEYQLGIQEIFGHTLPNGKFITKDTPPSEILNYLQNRRPPMPELLATVESFIRARDDFRNALAPLNETLNDRQNQLQDVIDRFTEEAGLPPVILELTNDRSFRGQYLDGELSIRTRYLVDMTPADLVNVIIHELTHSEQQFLIVRYVIDDLQLAYPHLDWSGADELNDLQLDLVTNRYKELTGAELPPEYIQEVSTARAGERLGGDDGLTTAMEQHISNLIRDFADVPTIRDSFRESQNTYRKISRVLELLEGPNWEATLRELFRSPSNWNNLVAAGMFNDGTGSFSASTLLVDLRFAEMAGIDAFNLDELRSKVIEDLRDRQTQLNDWRQLAWNEYSQSYVEQDAWNMGELAQMDAANKGLSNAAWPAETYLEGYEFYPPFETPYSGYRLANIDTETRFNGTDNRANLDVEVVLTTADGTAVSGRYNSETQAFVGENGQPLSGDFTFGQNSFYTDVNGNLVEIGTPDGTRYVRSNNASPWRVFDANGVEVTRFSGVLELDASGNPSFRIEHGNSTQFVDLASNTIKAVTADGVEFRVNSEDGLWYYIENGQPVRLPGEVAFRDGQLVIRTRQENGTAVTYTAEGAVVEVQTVDGVHFYRNDGESAWYRLSPEGVRPLIGKSVGFDSNFEPLVTYIDPYGNSEVANGQGDALHVITKDGVIFERVDVNSPWMRNDGSGVPKQIEGNVRLLNDGRVVIETIDATTGNRITTGMDGRVVVFNSLGDIVQIGTGDAALYFIYRDGAVFQITTADGREFMPSDLSSDGPTWFEFEYMDLGNGDEYLATPNILAGSITPRQDGGLMIVGHDGSQQIIYPGEGYVTLREGAIEGTAGDQVRWIFNSRETLTTPTNGLRVVVSESASAETVVLANSVDQLPARQRFLLDRLGVRVLAVDNINNYRPDLALQAVPGQDGTYSNVKAFYDPATRTIVLMEGASLANLSEEVWHAINHALQDFAGSPAFRSMYSLDTANPALTPERLSYFGLNNPMGGDGEAFQQAARILMKLDLGEQLTQLELDFLASFPATVEVTAQRLRMEGLMERGPWEIPELAPHTRATAENPHPDIRGDFTETADGSIVPPPDAVGRPEDLIPLAAEADIEGNYFSAEEPIDGGMYLWREFRRFIGWDRKPVSDFFNPNGPENGPLDTHIITQFDNGELTQASLELADPRTMTVVRDANGQIQSISFPGRTIRQTSNGNWEVTTTRVLDGHFEIQGDQLVYIEPNQQPVMMGENFLRVGRNEVIVDGRNYRLGSDGKWREIIDAQSTSGLLAISDNGTIRITDSSQTPPRVLTYGLDGSVTIESPVPGSRVEYEFASLRVEREILGLRAAELLGDESNPLRSRFDQLMRLVERRANGEGLSPENIAILYHHLNRLIAGDSSFTGVSIEGRLRLAEQILYDAAYPLRMDQGGRGTCTLAAYQKWLFTNDPAEGARIIVDMVLTGQFVSREGVVVNPFDGQPNLSNPLGPDAEAQRNFREFNSNHRADQITLDNARTWADQIFQVTVANLKWESMRLLPDGTPLQDGQYIRYEIVPRSIPPREILYVYSADGTRQALAENSPSMSVRDLLVLNRMITGSEDLFVLFGPKRPRPSAQENTQTTTTTVLDYTQNSRTTWARANSIDKLPSIFATVERNNGFPMIVSIKVENMNWGSYPRSQGTGGHAMLLTGYNLVYDGSGAIDYAASTVTMSNSWGAASHEMTVSFEDLFRALS